MEGIILGVRREKEAQQKIWVPVKSDFSLTTPRMNDSKVFFN
jgi:hypothetical protein